MNLQIIKKYIQNDRHFIKRLKKFKFFGKNFVNFKIAFQSVLKIIL